MTTCDAIDKIMKTKSTEERFEEYLVYLGTVAEYNRNHIPGITLMLRKQDHGGLPPDLARAVLGGLLLMSGQLDELFTEVIAHLQQPLSAEEADLLARTMVISGHLEQAEQIYRSLAAAGFSAYAISRLAALAYAQGKQAEADHYYGMFANMVDMSLLIESAKSFAKSVSENLMEHGENLKYWKHSSFSNSTVKRYKTQLMHQFKYTTAARHINDCIDERLGEAIDYRINICEAINYGAFYGLMDAERATRWPGIHWVGVDRDATAIAASIKDFTAPNLTFMVADEPMDALRRQTAVGDAALIHTRTGAMMTPRKLSLLYDAARNHGFRCVIGSEFVGGSLLEQRFFNPEIDKTSSACTSQVFNHNYKLLLRNSGYTIIKEKKEAIISYYGLNTLAKISHVTLPSIYSFFAVAD